MKILIHCTHYPVCSGRYAADAFRRLGHDVKTAGASTGRHIWNMEVPSEYVFTPDYAPDAIPDDFDLCVLMDTAYQWHHPTIPTVAWSVDNHCRDLRQEGIDHYFLAHRNVSMMDWETKHVPTEFFEQSIDVLMPTMRRDDPLRPDFSSTVVSSDMTHLPCCYDPIHFTPSPIPYTERKYDVACLGYIYPQRYALIKALIDAGLKVIWGCGLVFDNYVNAYHNSRISLCSSSNGDVAQRVFETAAMGCVVMTDKCPDFQILKPVGFWDYKRDADIVSEVKQVLTDPMKAQKQIALSQAWAQPHTWDERARKIIEWWGNNHA